MTWLDAKLHRDEHGRIIDPPIALPRHARVREYAGDRRVCGMKVGDRHHGREVVAVHRADRSGYARIVADVRCLYCGKRSTLRLDNVRKGPCRCVGYRR